MADSVLTPEELGAIARVNRDLGHAVSLSRTSVAWRRRLLAIIDRLVGRVEKLEEVAKAALREEHQPECGVFFRSDLAGTGVKPPCDCIHALALAALDRS